MSIVAASHEPGVLSAALAYLDLGISVIPCQGKQPALINGRPLAWGKFQTQLPPYSYIHNWYRAGLLQNIGLIGGSVSDNLVFVDLDGLEAVARFEMTFFHLLDTYTVCTGSGKGKHFYYYVDKLPPTTRTEGFELRADGCYVVAPPSIHPVTGKEYIGNRTEIKRVDNLRDVVQWIKDMIRAKHRATVGADKPSMGVRDSTAFGKTALDGEARRVAAAAHGDGNNTLYLAALKLGSLVRDNHLSINEVEIALMRACESSGLIERDTERQCLATIKSGLRTGMNSSRKEFTRR